MPTGRRALIALLGLSAGLVSGVTGVGGGVIIVPVLVLVARLEQHAAHGTSLAAMLLTASPAAARYAVGHEVDWLAALFVAFGGVIGARLGTRIACGLTAGLLRRLFSVVLLAAAANLIYKASGGAQSAGATSAFLSGGFPSHTAQVGLGIAGGTIAGCFGIGGGVLLVPGMALLLGFPQKLAQGVSLCAIVAIAVSGALAHRKREYVDIPTAATVGSGSLVGGLLGSQIAVAWASENALRVVFALLLVAVSAIMILRRAPEPVCN
jgi:uncharacterized membrane protein YfcA